MSDEQPDTDTFESAADTGESSVDLVERRYRRGVGITLALLALLGAWIAVLATNAGTNESRTARDATRLASEAQTADVVAKGAQAGIEQAEAEVAQFESRPGFQIESALDQAGVVLDPDSEAQRLADAQAELEAATAGYGARRTELDTTAAELALEQSAVVAERITWNNRASQYETVLTVLAVAIFLVGFTMVVSRGLRPPFVVPGTILGVVCLFWALQIHAKPVPTVAPDAISATATGQVALSEGRADDAVAEFTAAVAAQDDYAPAHEGLGTATLVAANPDLFRTWAITDPSPEVVDAAGAELERALSLQDPDQPQTVASAALVAVVAADWDRAAELIESAIALNGRTPGLKLSRSAVAVAQGDADLAAEWVARALPDLQELAGTDTDRALVAQYLTMLEWVAVQAPEQADLVAQQRDRGIALIAEARAADTPDAPIGPEAVAPPGAAVTVETLSFADGRTTAKFSVAGVAPTDQVILAVYERPSVGGPWVQPPQLFYVGPPPPGQGYTFDTPQACAPVEYRVDLYVNGAFATSVTAPGGAPTC